MKYTNQVILVEFKLALRGATDGDLRVGQAIQEQLAERFGGVWGRQVGIHGDGLVGFGDGQLIPASADRGETRQQSGSHRIARIGVRPRLERPVFPLQIAGDLPVVQCLDEEAFDAAGASAQLERLDRALAGQRRLSESAVANSEPRMGHRKIRVDVDRPLEQRQGGRRAG